MPVVNLPSLASVPEMTLLRSVMTGERRPNVTIVCGRQLLESTTELLRALCMAPYHACELPGTLDLRGCDGGTLLLHDVAALTTRQQIALFDWIERPRRDVQIISVTASPLHPLVRDGRFLEGLFYRLNTLSFTQMGLVHDEC
jgi:transcriptional regulator of acetoin/glycerol metabolism